MALAYCQIKWYQWFTYCIFNKYADFKGRARRAEYWSFTLIHTIINVSLSFLIALIGDLAFTVFCIMLLLFGLVTFMPGLAVGARRLHDIGLSGLWLLLDWLPLLHLVLFVFLVKDSVQEDNRFGPSPKYGIE